MLFRKTLTMKRVDKNLIRNITKTLNVRRILYESASFTFTSFLLLLHL